MEPVDANKNLYLKTFGPRLNALVADLHRYDLQGGYGGNLNLKQIISLITGNVNEISRLQQKIDDLKKELKEKESQLQKLGENISNG